MTNGTAVQSAPGMGTPPAPQKKKGIGMMGILAIVGGILLIVAFLMPMVSLSVEVSFMGYSTSTTSTASGLRLALGDTIPSGTTGVKDVSYPVFYAVILMGILAIVLVIMSKPIMKLLGGVMGILGTVCAFVGYMQISSDLQPAVDAFEASSVGSLDVGMGFGLYIAIIGGILALVGGVMAWMKAK